MQMLLALVTISISRVVACSYSFHLVAASIAARVQSSGCWIQQPIALSASAGVLPSLQGRKLNEQECRDFENGDEQKLEQCRYKSSQWKAGHHSNRYHSHRGRHDCNYHD